MRSNADDSGNNGRFQSRVRSIYNLWRWPNSKMPELSSTLQQQFEVELKSSATRLEHKLIAGDNSFNQLSKTTMRKIILHSSTDEFLLSLRWFISWRGTPQSIISDNAQQFKCASTTLFKAWRDVITHKEVGDFSTNCYEKWRFIVKLVPWKGGFYEWLVGLTKRALRKTIGIQSLTQRQLSTVLTEVEAVINLHPLQ